MDSLFVNLSPFKKHYEIHFSSTKEPSTITDENKLEYSDDCDERYTQPQIIISTFFRFKFHLHFFLPETKQKTMGLSGNRLLFIASTLLMVVGNLWNVESFLLETPTTSKNSMRLQAAGRGMGMGAAQKTTKDKKKKNGMGGDKNKPVTTFDVNASIIRMEKRYEEMLRSCAKSMAKEEDSAGDTNGKNDDFITSEFVIVAKADAKQGVRDWVPIAQLCVQRPENEYDNTNDILQESISAYCRELSYTASFGAPIFSSVPRNLVQYGVEPVDSFHKHVYDKLSASSAGKSDMTKAKARTILGLSDSESLDKSNVKQAYRRLSFQLHPDRFEGTEEESQEAAERYTQVQLAFETLSSGIREEGCSWYQSLGGKARTEFVGPVNLLPLEAAQTRLEQRRVKAAIMALDPTLTQTFVARNLRSQ